MARTRNLLSETSSSSERDIYHRTNKLDYPEYVLKRELEVMLCNSSPDRIRRLGRTRIKSTIVLISCVPVIRALCWQVIRLLYTRGKSYSTWRSWEKMKNNKRWFIVRILRQLWHKACEIVLLVSLTTAGWRRCFN